MKVLQQLSFLPANERFALLCVEIFLVFKVYRHSKASPAALTAPKLWNVLLFTS